MAPRDPNKVQLDFPVLVADLIDQLSLTGAVGVMEFSDVVTPVFLIGSRGITFGSELPDFASSEVFFGSVVSAAANTVIADTGQLAAGTYDITAFMTKSASSTLSTPALLQHRNAADNATLATLASQPMSGIHDEVIGVLPLMGYQIGLNERIRFINSTGVSTGPQTCTIMATIRPTP